MLHKEIPFLRICVSLCAGIVSGLVFKPGTIFFISTGIVVLTLLFLSYRKHDYSDSSFFGIALAVCLYLCGLLLYRQEKDSLSILGPQTGVFNCEVSEYPEEKASTVLVRVKLNARIVENGYHSLRGSMLLYLQKDEESTVLIPGDRLVIRCTPSQIVNRGNPDEFNYRFYMENLGIKYMAFTAANDLLFHEAPGKRKLVHKALIIRRKIISMYSNRGVSDDRLALVSALILGEKSNLDNDQKESFMKAGIMHVMAVSGLHAVILSMFIMNVLYFMKRKLNALRIVLTILFLWAFAFVTGLTPSVMRATLMFTFIQAGNLMHRRANGINSVLASAFVLMIIDPSVVFNAGFLLSYAAVIFIIAFYRELYIKVHYRNKIADWIWQSVAVTVVAQAGTLPLTIMFFNRFPVYFILTNLIIVPLSSLAIILGCMVPLFYPVTFISGLIGIALDKLTGLILALTSFAASLPFSGIENIGMGPVQCLLLFGLLSACLFIVLNRKKKYLLPVFILLSAYLASGAIRDVRTKSTSELIVYNSLSGAAAAIRTGKILNVYCSASGPPPEVRRHSAVKGLKVKMHIVDEPILVRSCNKFIQFGAMSALPNIQPDYIIIGDYKSAAKCSLYHNSRIILTGNIRRVPAALARQDSSSNVYLIRKSGAYITAL